MIEKNLKEIFESMGIYVTENDYEEKLEIDSLQFVNIIIAIENEFLIRISEDYYNYDILSSFKDFLNLINKYLGNEI